MKKNTVVFAVQEDDADGGYLYFPTLAAARADYGDECEVRQIVIDGYISRELACRLLNRSGYAVEETTTDPPKGKS